MNDESDDSTLEEFGRLVLVAYRKVGDWEVAKDLAGDALLKMQRAKNQPLSEAHRSNWVRQVGENVATDYLRREKIISFVSLPEERYDLDDSDRIRGRAPLSVLADERMDPAIQVDEREDARVLLRAFSRLSMSDRETIKAIDDEVPASELRRMWCLTSSGVSERKRRARERFAELLREEGLPVSEYKSIKEKGQKNLDSS